MYYMEKLEERHKTAKSKYSCVPRVSRRHTIVSRRNMHRHVFVTVTLPLTYAHPAGTPLRPFLTLAEPSHHAVVHQKAPCPSTKCAETLIHLCTSQSGLHPHHPLLILKHSCVPLVQPLEDPEKELLEALLIVMKRRVNQQASKQKPLARAYRHTRWTSFLVRQQLRPGRLQSHVWRQHWNLCRGLSRTLAAARANLMWLQPNLFLESRWTQL